MRSINRFFPALVFGVLLASMIGCASTSTTEGTGGYVDDSVLSTKVKAVLLHTSGVDSTEITVETFKGVVKLSGYLESEAMIDSAVAAAQSVNGVKSVDNDLTVKGKQ